MKKILLLLIALSIISCKDNNTENTDLEETQNDTIAAPEERTYKVLDSEFITKEDVWAPLASEMNNFSEERYEEIFPLIFDKNIPEIQLAIENSEFTYEELVLFYLHRIQKFDRENDLSLNSVISLNPNIIKEAREKDAEFKAGGDKHLAFGMPILLKDNINTENMPTTAGAVALQNNTTNDAYVVERYKENGGLILGKANLSEWAYFFCGDCPSGYSAVGGQTLNPYGRKIFDTGGSSSGSAVAIAANFAVGALGSETSGSILSPSSQNSVVGLKPTIGVLSRGGIVPISSTLDTPGPITKSVIDNAILLSAMAGKDAKDPAAANNKNVVNDYHSALKETTLEGKRFGAIKALMENELYAEAIEDLKAAGAEIVEFEPADVDLPNFIRLLNLDMKKDLPEYFENYGGKNNVTTVEDVIAYNNEDSTARAPYGQRLFYGIENDSATPQEFAALKDTLSQNGKRFFDVPMEEHNLDAIVSINNYHAGFAAVAHYPAITVPMGYNEDGQPMGITFIAKGYNEAKLYEFAYGYEQESKNRKSPENYIK